jgi:hypothetical protein
LHEPMDKGENKDNGEDIQEEGDVYSGKVFPVDVFPAQYENHIPVDQIIRIKFNEHLDIDSITTNRISLSSGPLGYKIMAHYNPLAMELLIWSNVYMLEDTVYLVAFEKGIKSLNGNELSHGVVTTFKTGSEKSLERPFEKISWAEGVSTLFKSRCSSCHGGVAPMAGLDLSSQKAVVETAVNVVSPSYQGWQRLSAYKPGKSYLLYKLFENDYKAGALMPRTMDGTKTTLLFEDEIEMVKNWIQSGLIF